MARPREGAHRRRLAVSTAIFAGATGCRASSASSARSSRGATSASRARGSTRSRPRSRCRTSSAASSPTRRSPRRSSRSSPSCWRRGEGARLARRLDPLLAPPPRPRRPDRALHARRAARDAPVRLRGRAAGARGHALADPVPDRRAARRLGRDRRDPQLLRAVLDPGADAGRLEPRDHRRPRRRRAADGQRHHRALRLRGLDPRRHRRPGAAPGAVAPRPRRAAPGRDRLARPAGEARAWC